MPVGAYNGPDTYTGTGVATSYAYNFKITDQTHLRVTIDGTVQTLTTHYTVTGVGEANGGNVVPVSAAHFDGEIVIERVVPYTRTTDFQRNNAFDEETVDDDFDRATMQIQQLKAITERAVLAPAGETLSELPSAADRASAYFAFDASGNPMASAAQSGVPTSAFMATLLDDTTAGAALVTLGTGRMVDTIAALKALPKAGSTKCFVLGYYAAGDGGGGEYYYDSADTTTADNGGSVIVADDGARWKLVIRGHVSLKQFGCKIDGATDDSARLLAAGNTGHTLYHPGGTLIIDSPVDFDAGACPSLFGTPDSIIKAGASFASSEAYMLSWDTASAFFVRDITVDRNWTTPPTGALTAHAGLRFFACEMFLVDHCSIPNMYSAGIHIQGGRKFWVRDCDIDNAVPTIYESMGIYVTNDGRQSQDGHIEANTLSGCVIETRCVRFSIIANDVSAYEFGAGITTEADNTDSVHGYIAGNRCYSSGTAIDVNGSYPSGIETWSNDTAVIGNICHTNAGAGISQGGQRCKVLGNTCYNNGQGNGWGGIISRYTSASQNANSSVYVGNTCFDTQGASATQSYGYQDESSSLARIVISGNDFNSGHVTAPMLVQGSRCMIDGALNGSASWTPGTVNTGASSGTGVTVAGAAVGDLVSVSLDADNQNCAVTGYVNATNNVIALITNGSGANKTFAALTVRATVHKRMNFATY